MRPRRGVIDQVAVFDGAHARLHRAWIDSEYSVGRKRKSDAISLLHAAGFLSVYWTIRWIGRRGDAAAGH